MLISFGLVEAEFHVHISQASLELDVSKDDFEFLVLLPVPSKCIEDRNWYTQHFRGPATLYKLAGNLLCSSGGFQTQGLAASTYQVLRLQAMCPEAVSLE